MNHEALDEFGQPIISLNEQIQEIERELRQRSYSYPRMVTTGRLSAAASGRRLAVMRAVLETLEKLKSERRPVRTR